MVTSVNLPKVPELVEGGAVPMCRFLKKPFPECYCLNICGKNIHKILLFCAADYTACAIYRAMTGEGGTQAAAEPDN